MTRARAASGAASRAEPRLPGPAKIDRSFFERGVEIVARDLIGVSVYVDGVGGSIVETEAYDAEDPAAHSFRGPTARNAPMFGPAGHLYVYRIYGLHFCMNFTCGQGAGVLIRAIEPDRGLDIMRGRRGAVSERLLCAGPGRLCQALAIDLNFAGRPLDRPPFELYAREADRDVTACRRIGIKAAADMPRRFCDTGSPFLSRAIGRN